MISEAFCILVSLTPMLVTCRKPTAHLGTFSFADTKNQKSLIFFPTLDRKFIN